MAAFATAADLAARLNVTFTAGESAQATQLLEGASSYIRALVGQEISEVEDDEVTLLSPPSQWLVLPEGPVTDVSAVVIDGTASTDYQRVGRRLYNALGWLVPHADTLATPPGYLASPFVPEVLQFVEVTYTHGYTSADDLALAKDAALVMAASSVANTASVKSERIDDYAVEFADLNTSAVGPNLERALKKKYGARPSTGSIESR